MPSSDGFSFPHGGPSILETAWHNLDQSYYDFVNDQTLDEVEKDCFKNFLRGQVTVLVLFMAPHYRTIEELINEVHNRYVQHHINGDPGYDSAGLGSRRQEFPNANQVVKSAHNLNEAQIVSIRKALGGGFSASELAEMYSVSKAVILSL